MNSDKDIVKYEAMGEADNYIVDEGDSSGSVIKDDNVDTNDDNESKDEFTKPKETNKVFCSLGENDQEIINNEGWRDESLNNYESDEEDGSEEDESEDGDEDEEAAQEWLRRYELRRRGLPEVLATLPATIKVSLVPESREEEERREQRRRAELGRLEVSLA